MKFKRSSSTPFWEKSRAIESVKKDLERRAKTDSAIGRIPVKMDKEDITQALEPEVIDIK